MLPIGWQITVASRGCTSGGQLVTSIILYRKRQHFEVGVSASCCAKRLAGSMDKRRAESTEALFQTMADPVPGPMTGDGEEEQEELVALAGMEQLRACKRARIERPRYCVCQCAAAPCAAAAPPAASHAAASPSASAECGMSDSQASTAASTPTGACTRFSADCDPFLVVEPPTQPAHRRMDYGSLSDDELRDVLGTKAPDWERDELIGVLEEIDRICWPLLDVDF